MSEPGVLSLRPLVEDDWRAVQGWASRSEVCLFQAWGPNSEEDTRRFVRDASAAWLDQPQVRFVYAITVDDRVVGNCELNLRGGQQGEISYGLHPDVWGRGYATLAVRQLLAIGFRDRGLHRIFATCDPRNAASVRVLQRTGMTHEGRMREVMKIRDGWRDSELYAVLVNEFAEG